MQYERNDMNLARGKFRVRGDTIEVHPAYEETAVRIELFGDEVERIPVVDPLTGEQVDELDELVHLPGHALRHRRGAHASRRSSASRPSCRSGSPLFEEQGKLLEAQRLRMRTQYDLEMMQEVGYCTASRTTRRTLDGRGPGEPPYTLLDFFPDDFLMVDRRESHVTVPQLHGQYEGDRSPQGDARRARLPPAVGRRQPAAALRRVS